MSSLLIGYNCDTARNVGGQTLNQHKGTAGEKLEVFCLRVPSESRERGGVSPVTHSCDCSVSQMCHGGRRGLQWHWQVTGTQELVHCCSLHTHSDGVEVGLGRSVSVSLVLLGGKGGEGGRRGEGEGARLSCDAPSWRGVCRWLRDTEWGENQGGVIIFSSFLKLARMRVCACACVCISSPDRVAAAVGWICYPGNKKFLWGPIRLRPSWETT